MPTNALSTEPSEPELIEPTGTKPILLKYQRRWIMDRSKLKIWLKSRQIGFSFAGTLESTLDCCERKNTLWLFLSAGQRQSLELGEKAKQHVAAIAAIEQAARGATSEKEHWGFVDDKAVTQTTITFRNGSRMLFLPSKPETVRGYTGNVFGDEFALHAQAKAIYAAVYPSTTRGYRMLIGSTPLGESGMFYELCTKANGYSKHVTTIQDAVNDGLVESMALISEKTGKPVTRAEYLQELRDGCPDEDIWEQEYFCKFLSDATSYIPWEMITGGESELATTEIPEYWIPKGELYLGADIGRHRDLTVFILLERIGEVFYIRAIRRMAKARFAEQKAYVRALMSTYRIRRYCQDGTGLGMQMAEEMTEEFGSSRVEGITFTAQTKEDMAVRTRRAYEDKNIRTPVGERNFRAAMHAVRRYPTAGGHFRFDADRTDAGHADEFWALALALTAADATPVVVSGLVASTMRPSARQMLRGY